MIGNTVKLIRIAVSDEVEDVPPDDSKSKAVRALGTLGGAAHTKSMNAKKQKEIAKKAAASWWK